MSNARGAATPAKSRSEEPEGSAALEEDTFEGASEVTSVALVRQVRKAITNLISINLGSKMI